jgi:HD-GYP domain-containing protein (c-di-GMP phosphodiesterase class II)
MLAELASALAARDPSTAAHCARVTFLSRRLAT